MLQDIRHNIQGTLAKIIIGLIVVSFSIFGIESILVGGGSSGVAEVNGEDISAQELQQAVNNQKRRLISMMGDNIDPAMLDDNLLSGQALESLIGRKLLMQSAEGMGLTISDAELGRLVSSMEQFQINGQFSPELYKSTLSTAGFTPTSFKQTLAEDLMVSQLRTGLAGSEFATPAELKLNARIVGEQRDLRYMTLPLDAFMPAAEISDADMRQYYEEHIDQFQREESVDLSYIQLQLDDFREPVEEAALQEAYELEMQNYAYGNRYRVSHILIEGDNPEKLAAAQAALAEGRSFAEVAAEFSDDIGSAGNGGDLGYTSGDTFPEAMEEAIAALELNSVSEPVETDAGSHLILVTERDAEEAPTLDELRMELTDRLQVSEARVQLLRAVESLKDLAFNAEDLSEPARELDLRVQQVKGITRTQSEGLFSNATLLAAAFGEEVLEQGHNSEVMELGGDQWVVLRVDQHSPAAPRPLEDVRGEVRVAVQEDRARATAEAAAQRALVALREGDTIESYANAQGFEWQVQRGVNRNSPLVPREALQRAFELPAPDGDSTFEYVSNPLGDIVVLELMAVQPGELATLEEPARQRLSQQVAGEYGRRIDEEYRSGLRQRADISVM